MKNQVSLASMALAITFLGAYAFSGTSVAQSKREGFLDSPVKNLQMKEKNIGLILSRFSDQNNIPIGFEVAVDDDLSITRSITVDVKDGTVEGVLNSIVQQNPVYTWEVRNNVVNVFPRERNRDLVLKEVLESRLDKVSIAKQTTRFSLRETLCKNETVMKILNLHDVTPDNESFMSRDFNRLGRDFSFEASNVSVATVLNRVIRDSQTKYWVIMRFGKRKQYLVLNL